MIDWDELEKERIAIITHPHWLKVITPPETLFLNNKTINMKWIPIDKAKVKFEQLYLVAYGVNRPACGSLLKSETTAKGIVHQFTIDTQPDPVIATHVAIITNP